MLGHDIIPSGNELQDESRRTDNYRSKDKGHWYWRGQGTKKLEWWVHHLCGHWSHSRLGMAQRQEPESKALSTRETEVRTAADSDGVVGFNQVAWASKWEAFKVEEESLSVRYSGEQRGLNPNSWLTTQAVANEQILHLLISSFDSSISWVPEGCARYWEDSCLLPALTEPIVGRLLEMWKPWDGGGVTGDPEGKRASTEGEDRRRGFCPRRNQYTRRHRAQVLENGHGGGRVTWGSTEQAGLTEGGTHAGKTFIVRSRWECQGHEAWRS